METPDSLLEQTIRQQITQFQTTQSPLSPQLSAILMPEFPCRTMGGAELTFLDLRNDTTFRLGRLAPRT